MGWSDAINRHMSALTIFAPAKLKQNVEALLSDLKRLKPSAAKGVYVKRVTLSTTMGPGLQIDQASLEA